ncbi:MAG: FAD-binding oxidoreductase [bacterium]
MNFLLSFLLCLFFFPPAFAAPATVNDVTQINPIVVDEIVKPHSIAEIQEAVKNHHGPISIGGGHFSMGGQTATEKSLHLDLREFDQVVDFSAEKKIITVQTGITWKKIQEKIDPHNLSLKIMQSYSNFTVGGSLSVNVHGRYVGQGPLIKSVRSLKIVLADGSLVEASPTQNPEIFYGAIGGYGGLGVIVEATLDLADNVRVERQTERMPVTRYKDFFFEKIRKDPKAIFHNGDLYPPEYDTVTSVTWVETEKPVTEKERLIPPNADYGFNRAFILFITEFPLAKEIRAWLVDPWTYRSPKVVWRNYEASYDVSELEPTSRKDSTYVLQEYFVPVENFDAFVPKMRGIFQRHGVNVLNVSIRHAHPDPGSLLAWAPKESFSFVVYYKQGTGEEDKKEVGRWTRELIDAVTSANGTYYLPYQIHATDAQFLKAYPRATEFFALKKKWDPGNKFRNKLWDRYYSNPPEEIQKRLRAMKGYARSEEQTFLTLPEWYIVFAYDELAAFLKNQSPSDFPYFQSIGEFWKIYRNVIAVTKGRYPFNWGYHVMNAVIGVSFTAEYAIKGIYEDTVGRFTRWAASGETEEDRFIQKVSQEYANFTHLRPWYEFQFFPKLKEFWETTPLWGKNVLRKWERKIFLTHEFTYKAVYGWLIGKATQAGYGAEDDVILVWARNVPPAAFEKDSRIKLKETFPDGSQLLQVPRYEPFRGIMTDLSKGGAEFIEIAGNGRILLTLLAPRGWQNDTNVGDLLFESKAVIQPSFKRMAFDVPVRFLNERLKTLERAPVIPEHLYDY